MAQIAPIEAATYKIGTFLGDRKLRIPELQRPYSWTKKEAAELLDDLDRVGLEPEIGFAPQHFFGTIVLLNTADKRMHIIDGQQRLTTTSLLLGLLEQSILRVRDRAEKNGPAAKGIASNANDLAQKVHDLLWYVGPLDNLGNAEHFPRVLVSPEIADRYLKLIQGEKPRIPAGIAASPEKQLLEIALFMQDHYVEPIAKAKKPAFKGLEPVDQLRHLGECVDCITERLLVVSLTTQSANAGYDLFECLNARGLDLEALDLVKVWMLSRMAGPREEAVAVAMRELSSGNRAQQSKFFVDYFKIAVGKNPKNDSPKVLAVDARVSLFHDEQFSTVPQSNSVEDRIEIELKRMKELSPIWHELQAGRIPKEVSGTGQARNWGQFRLELTTKDLGHNGLNYPLLTVAAEVGGNQFSDFLELIHIVERFFFRFKVICGGHVGELETAYFDLIRNFKHKSAIDLKYARERLQELLDLRANDSKFEIQMLDKLSYSAASKKRIRYFLYTLDNYSYPGKPGTDSVDLSQYHIEHIAPQNPATGKTLDLVEIHGIGNLALLNPSINSTLSNLNFPEKRKEAAKLKNKGKEINIADSRAVFYDSTSDSWTRKEIDSRRDRLFEHAKVVFKLV
jgi:hypothetical protein